MSAPDGSTDGVTWRTGIWVASAAAVGVVATGIVWSTRTPSSPDLSSIVVVAGPTAAPASTPATRTGRREDATAPMGYVSPLPPVESPTRSAADVDAMLGSWTGPGGSSISIDRDQTKPAGFYFVTFVSSAGDFHEPGRREGYAQGKNLIVQEGETLRHFAPIASDGMGTFGTGSSGRCIADDLGYRFCQ
jgi:hypothetical protein